MLPPPIDPGLEVGKPKLVTKIDNNKHGIYDVTLIHKYDSEPYDYLEFVPR